jgi:hypothetical protein
MDCIFSLRLWFCFHLHELRGGVLIGRIRLRPLCYFPFFFQIFTRRVKIWKNESFKYRCEGTP